MKKIVFIVIIGLISLGVFFLQFGYKRQSSPNLYYQVYLDDEVIGVIDSKDELDEYINKQGALIRSQVIDYQAQLETLGVVDTIIKNKLNNYPGKETFLKMQNQYKQLSSFVTDYGSFAAENRSAVVEIIETIPEEYRKDITVANTSIPKYTMLVNRLDNYFLAEKAVIMNFILEKQATLSLTEAESFRLSEYFSNNMNEISYVKQVYMQQYAEENKIYLYVTDIYSPLGINVKKINTYHANVSLVSEVYQEIIDRKPCTVEGYQFRVKKSGNQSYLKNLSVGAVLANNLERLIGDQPEDEIIYVTNPKIFDDAIEKMELVFVGSELFEKYKKGTQAEIKDTGTYIQDVYVDEDITIKKTNVSVKEEIYNDADELSSYLLYGKNKEVKTVKALASDTIPNFAYKNGISVEEFFLSNPDFTSVNNIFYNGQEVVIAKIDPKLSIVVEQHTVADRTVQYDKIEQYDSNMNSGARYVAQTGINGIERVAENVKLINGTINYVNPVSNATIKSARSEITYIGTRNIPRVGSLGSWGWPATGGTSISSYYGYRIIYGKREFHTGLDIPGGGYGSIVRASNNGVIIAKEYQGTYGNVILIDHNNGYYTLYAHMSGYAKGMAVGTVVSRGQTIGYIGTSGRVTGPHLHFEIRVCPGYGCHVDPWPYLRQ